MSLECLCVRHGSGKAQASGGVLRAKLSCAPACVIAKPTGRGSIKALMRRERGGSAKLTATGHITGGEVVDVAFENSTVRALKPRLAVDFYLGGAWEDRSVGEGDDDSWIPPQFHGHGHTHYGKKVNPVGVFSITPGLTQVHNPSKRFKATGSLRAKYADKFAGSFNDFGCFHKLYPIKDIDVLYDGGYFVNESNNSGNLYDSVDEGVFTGSYHTQSGISYRISDDLNTFIQPSAVYTTGRFRYKCEVTNPAVTAKDSRFYFRASAPRENYSSKVPPVYKVQNIRLEDPSGNLIIKYENISLRGDADYDSYQYVNFGTYGSKPETNNLLLHTWHADYPFMEEGAGYTLSFEVDVECLDDPFDRGFDPGYEDTCALLDPQVPHSGNDYLALDGAPLATQTQRLSFLNPTNTIRISAIEICNSGGFDTLREQYMPIHFGVQETGRRMERCILPSLIPTYEFDAGVYPTSSSVWSDSITGLTNQSGVGAGHLTSLIRNPCKSSAITLSSANQVADSGKLLLEFRHQAPKTVSDFAGGAFDGSYLLREFSVSHRSTYTPDDHPFIVDSVYLKVLAKKEVGSRDYALDIVGWSDDRLLNVTSAVGGFLQNPSGSENNFAPISSGFNPTNELALGGESLSDKSQYYDASGTCNAGGDHYILSNTPMVTGTSFGWYEVPLTIYDDCVTLGKSPDFSQSSFFERLFLDIFPLPSGASIAAAELCVKYKPANGLNLNTIGYERISRIGKTREEGKITPIGRQTADDIINAGSGLSSLSAISNIPHGFTTPDDIKSNYSRRWRGLEGIVQGPFDPDMFGFGFKNPTLDFPLLSGFYDFDYDNNLIIKSRPLGSGFGSATGTMTTSYSEHHFKNLGWRFNSSGLFNQSLPDLTGPYRTTDWTSLSKTGFNFESHELHGQIADAFNNVVRLSGVNSYINFGHIDTVSGFSIYTRFTPDANVSGVGFNLFESGALVSKWDAGKDLEFALGYENGYLCGYATDKDDNLVKVKDTITYDKYQYPLSALLTYNDNNSSGLKLYTDNELHSGVFNTLRASSSEFYKKTGDSNIVLGYSPGSGVGMNMFVSEFGIGTYHESGCHIVEADPDLTFKEILAENFLAGNRVKFWASGEPSSNDRYKLWSYVDEDTLKWDLGAFKVCEFSPDFDFFTDREGRDLISINIKHDGSGYLQRVDMPMPESISYSGLAYHTQIENDFLRFNLSDASDNFYTANHPRITKSLPQGYAFADRAFVVETVLEHETLNSIAWPDGKLGPKLIVSLYTKNQEPSSFSTTNYGLINRDIHYLKPSGCWRRIDSTFNYNSFFDESEEWALFPPTRRLTEFNKKYYSQDVNDMFLQYDLVYPSGPAFESRVNVHSAHVRLEDAFIVPTEVSGNVNLTTSGEQRPRETLPLHSMTICHLDNLSSGHRFCSGILEGIYPSGLTLYTQGPTRIDSLFDGSGMTLFTSGAIHLLGSGFFNLLASGGSLGSAGSSGTGGVGGEDFLGMNLYVSGQYALSARMPLFAFNNQISFRHGFGPFYVYGTENGNHSGVNGHFYPLYTNRSAAESDSSDGLAHAHTFTEYPGITFYMPHSDQNHGIDKAPSYLINYDVFPKYPALNLNTHASTHTGHFSHIPIYLHQYAESVRSDETSSLNMYTKALGALASRYTDGFFNLYTGSPATPSAKMPLVIWNDISLIPSLASGSFNLHTATFGAGLGADYMTWNEYNYGHDITIDDNSFATLEADDEIRGVDMVCYGACDADGNEKCNDPPVFTHDVVWRPESCVTGGIFRPFATYTNLDTRGFNTDVGYSGHFYGMRKYTDLKPNAPYALTLRGSTGTTRSIPLPRDWEEWEYGSVDDVKFSGIKFIGDYPYLSGQKPITPPSGRMEGDRYGKAISVTDELMVVGAPLHEFDEQGGNTYFDSGNSRLAWVGGSGLTEAGAVYLYRRGPQPQSPNMHPSGHKAYWNLESKIVLPSAYRGDWFHWLPGTMSFGGLPKLPVRQWEIGQEGRRLGHSLDVASTIKTPSLYETKREIIVAGAPRGSWSREFDDVVTSPIKVAVMVFSDEFVYNERKASIIKAKVDAVNMLYRYYSCPPRELDLQVLVYEPTGVGAPGGGLIQGTLDWIHHSRIPRNTYTHGQVDNTDEITSGIKSLFHEAFPYDVTKPHNNIPPIVGFYIDDSRSLGREELTPAIDQFVGHYNQYSFLSGVQDVYDVQDSGHIYEYIPAVDAGEDWVRMTNTLTDSLLDSGRLIRDDGLRFICSELGLECQNPNLKEFNLPPASGGRVYIFEKESGVWNLIQEIKRPALEFSENDPDTDAAAGLDEGEGEFLKPVLTFDGFGHAVAISKNTEVVSIGSPYVEEACLIYQYDPAEKNRLYSHVKSWLTFKNEDKQYDDVLARWEEYERTFGDMVASQMIYTELSPSEKFTLRSDPEYWQNDVNGSIQEYRKIFQYGYSNIHHRGTWQFIPSNFAPTSRLGWSTAVSEDGDTAVFGAPTDSFNEFDDTNVYYKSHNTWSSYVNAGAVRVFESRKYNPHSGVVEFYKFGNLDESTRPVSARAEDYNDLQHTFGTENIPFHRTKFTDVEIPRTAGLAFIISPEIDAASDEVIENIKDWLALGDRTLVIAGNDPVWEGNGKYETSNKIINKILSKLDSRMRLHPARNEYESLPSCMPSGRANVLPSFFPAGGRSTEVTPQTMFAKGVADIRIELPTWGTGYSPCDTLNTKCELPSMHQGDLRFQWGAACRVGGKCDKIRRYPVNWPFFFGTIPWPCPTCDPDPRKPPIGPNEEPKPLLVAAEYIPSITITYPAWDSTHTEPIMCRRWIDRPDMVRYEYNPDCFESAEFTWSENSDDYTSEDRARYIDPEEYEGRDALIYAKGKSKDTDPPVRSYENVLPETTLVSSEAWSGNATSKVVMIAAVTPEGHAGPGRYNLTYKGDDNTSFYLNLTTKKCVGKIPEGGVIAQLGGWTKRTSFQDAFIGSHLGEWEGNDFYGNKGDGGLGLFNTKGWTLTENYVVEETDHNGIHESYNVCWVANPDGLPKEQDVEDIKEWLDKGDKTLVITYANELYCQESDETGYKPCNEGEGQYSGEDTGRWPPSQKYARIVENLCDTFGIKMRPAYLPGEGQYAEYRLHTNGVGPEQERDSNDLAIKGCGKPAHKVKRLYVDEWGEHILGPNFIPIDRSCTKTGENEWSDCAANRMVWYPYMVRDIRWTPASPFWQIKPGLARLEVPALANSGYRLFYTYVTELPDEKNYLRAWTHHVRRSPHPDHKSGASIKLYDYDDNDKPVLAGSGHLTKDLIKTPVGTPVTVSMNVRAGHEVDNLEFYIEGTNLRAGKTSEVPNIPKTVRLLAVSGALLPVNKFIQKQGYWEDYVCGEREVTVHHPAETYTIPERMRPIMTDNTKYCRPVGGACADFDKKLIADGPVIAAEEPEHFSVFPAGHKRSNIVLLSDTSMIQGDCGWYRETPSDAFPKQPNRDFILSLYPQVFHRGWIGNAGEGVTAAGADLRQNLEGGREFRHIKKLLAPDRGSPHKYWAASGLTGLIENFDSSPGFGGSPTRAPLSYFTDDFNLDPKDVDRPPDPKTGEQIKKEIERFRNVIIPAHGPYSKFSGEIDGIPFIDPGPGGGVAPNMVAETTYDILDFDRFPSGYPGDLFGYAVSLYSGKLVIGAPYNGFINVSGERTTLWDDVINSNAINSPSGLRLSNYGGAGAAYYFERTGKGSGVMGGYQPWEFLQKIKPSGVNVGQDATDTLSVDDGHVLGHNSYSSEDVTHKTNITDRFGQAVSIDSDFVAIGAPGHDFATYHDHIYDGVHPQSGAFLRKEFNVEFDIPLHKIYDLGESGLRNDFKESGIKSVLNNGAVFTFDHRIVDWPRRIKEWTFAEKITAQGYNSRKQKSYEGAELTPVSGAEDDHFGESVAIHRSKRTDSDYTMAVGAPHHMFAASGNHTTSQPLLNAGAAYTYDAMLRRQLPSNASPDNWIMADLFGEISSISKDLNHLKLHIEQNATGSPIKYETSGVVWTNVDGEIFLEASGQDPATKSFIEHRSYIEVVFGNLHHGTPVNDAVNLFTSGIAGPSSGNMNLVIMGPDSSIVYNSMGLYSPAVLGYASGVEPWHSGLFMYMDCPVPIGVSGIHTGPTDSGLCIWTSGIGVINPSGYANGVRGAYYHISDSGVFGSDGSIFHKPFPLSIRGK